MALRARRLDLANNAACTVRSYAPVTAAETPIFASNVEFPRAVGDRAFYTSTQSTIATAWRSHAS